jgi:carbonic anhydrase/acetyltransferase-like protein (isoleucine patch superfamily)
VLCGAVTLGERARVLHGAVLTAEDGEIWIGDDVVIMENALVRARLRQPVSVGDAVLIGPHAHLNGATVEDEVFVATGASLFPGSVAASGSELRINSVLHVNSKLAP